MFDLIQEKDLDGKISDQTIVYVVVHADPERDAGDKLSERGRNQVFELAHSRVIADARRIYSSPEKIALNTAGVLRKELDIPIQAEDCLESLDYHSSQFETKRAVEEFQKFWKDQSYPLSGVSLDNMKNRLMNCLNTLVSTHKDDSIVLVVDPLVGAIIHSLIVGNELQPADWLNIGLGSCATYEHIKRSWTLVMPPDDSFLSSQVPTAEILADDLVEILLALKNGIE